MVVLSRSAHSCLSRSVVCDLLSCLTWEPTVALRTLDGLHWSRASAGRRHALLYRSGLTGFWIVLRVGARCRQANPPRLDDPSHFGLFACPCYGDRYFDCQPTGLSRPHMLNLMDLARSPQSSVLRIDVHYKLMSNNHHVGRRMKIRWRKCSPAWQCICNAGFRLSFCLLRRALSPATA